MVKAKGTRPQIDLTKVRKGKTIPDQSMDIKELIRRYVKGIPADVVQREKTFIDQGEQDLEALSRLDATDRAFTAQTMREDVERKHAIATDAMKLVKDNEERQKAEREKRENQIERESGIDYLDNTMPDDTDLNSRPLLKRRSGNESGGKKSKS